MKIIFWILTIFSFLGLGQFGPFYLPQLVYRQEGNIQVQNPEVSKAFYDEFKGGPRNYLISSGTNFNLYLHLLLPESSNLEGKYSAAVFKIENGIQQQVAFIGQNSVLWEDFYDPSTRDYYIRGPEFEKELLAGDYKIEVFKDSENKNEGKFVLLIGKEQTSSFLDFVKLYFKVPTLKSEFFGTPVEQFLITPFGLLGILIGFVLLSVLIFFLYVVFLLREKIAEGEIRTLILTSAGMQVKDEIIKMIAKPLDTVRVGYVITASKLKQDTSHLDREREIMRQLGFSVEDIDIEGKNKNQLIKMLETKDIIYVQGGNTFYLLKHIKLSKFDKAVKELLKKGLMYVGVSAGSIVAGRTIETAAWGGDENVVKLKKLWGMNLVKFNVFVHYKPEYAELIKEKYKKSFRDLRVLTDDQALVVQGTRVILVGKGQKIDPRNL